MSGDELPQLEVMWKGPTKPEDRTEADLQFMSRAVHKALEDEKVMEEVGSIDNIKTVIYVERKLVNFILKVKKATP